MATNDTFTITLSGKFQLNLIQNLFTYRAISSGMSASMCSASFLSSVYQAVKDVVSTEVTFDSLAVFNLSNPIDFVITPLLSGNTGTQTGESLPSRCALRLFSPTKNRDIRQGSKRFGVLSEAWASGSLINHTSGVDDNIDALIDALSANLTGSGGAQVASPVIIKRIKGTSASGKPVYTIPATATTSNSYIADNWQADEIISTVASRKLGRGA